MIQKPKKHARHAFQKNDEHKMTVGEKLAGVSFALLLTGATYVLGQYYFAPLKPIDGEEISFEPQVSRSSGSIHKQAPARTRVDEVDDISEEKAGLEASVPSLPRWRQNAVQPPALDGRIPIAIVIDDMGHDADMTDHFALLQRPMTFSFLPYIRHLKEQAKTVSVMGHELMLHLPMEPSGGNNPGPNALVKDLPYEETMRRVQWNLDQFDGYIGLNNHMGSEYTASRSFMFPVLQVVKKCDLLFLDSKTTARSVAGDLADELHIPTLERDVFLDNERDVEKIMAQLETTERVALKQGYAIAIGHPYPETYAALKDWLPTLKDKGFILWPVSAFIDYRSNIKKLR